MTNDIRVSDKGLDLIAALRKMEAAGTRVLAAMDEHNEKNGTYLGGPAFFELGRAVAVARASLSQKDQTNEQERG